MSKELLSYKIFGTVAQVLEISIEPNKILIADGGMLLYLDEELTHETKINDGASEIIQDTESEGEDDDDVDFYEPQQYKVPDLDDFPLPSRIKNEPEEEEDNGGTLIGKFWKVTQKTLAQIGQRLQPKKEEAIPVPKITPASHSFEENEREEDAQNEENDVPKKAIYSWYITHFANPSEYIRKIGFTTTHGGLVIPILLDELENKRLIIRTGSFLCARFGIKLDKFLDTGLKINFTQTKLFKLDIITGEGIIFLRGEGQVMRKEMENDVIRLNLFSLLAYEDTLTLDTESIRLVDAMNYDDQMQFVVLSGTGKYWLQTASLEHLVGRINPVVIAPDAQNFELAPPLQAFSTNEEEDEQDFSPQRSIEDEIAHETANILREET